MRTCKPYLFQTALFIIFLSLTIVSCSKKGDSNSPGNGGNNGNGNTPDSGNIIPHTPSVLDTFRNILLITPQAAAGLTVINDSTLSIPGLSGIQNLSRPSTGAKDVTAIAAKDILFADKSTQLGNGLMAAVTSVKPGNNGSWLVGIASTGLETIYKHLDLDWKRQLDTLQTQKGFNVNIPVGPSGKLNISGSYKLYITSNVAVLIEDAQLKKAECKLEGHIVLKANSTLAMNVIQKDTTILLDEIPLVQSDQLTIGKVRLPFVLSAKLRINLKVKASGTMELSASYDYDNQTYVDLAYTGGIPLLTGKFLDDKVNKFTKTSKVAGSFSAGIQAQLAASFFKTDKIALTAGLSVSGLLEGNCVDKGIDLKGTIKAQGTIGGEINLFNVFPLSKDLTVFDYEKMLFDTVIDDGGLCSMDMPPAAATGGSHGDVHCFTFDQRSYDFQSFGEFIAVQDDALTVQVRQGAIGTNKKVTYNKALVVGEGSDLVEFQLEPLKLFINKQARDMTGKIQLSGRGYVENTNHRLSIRLSNGDRVDIAWYDRGYFDYSVGLSDAHKGKIKGLLGNWNGSRDDELALRADGSIVGGDFASMYPTYANSWRITGNESLFYYDDGRSTVDYTDYSYPSSPVSLTATEIDNARQACSTAGITSEPALSNCILDVGVTGDAGYTESGVETQSKFQLQDPVLYLPLDGDAKDKSPWGNDGILKGEYSFTTDRKGHSNSALSLAGKGWIDVPNNPVIKSLSHTLTVSGWVLATNTYNGFILFACKSYNNQAGALQVEMTNVNIGSNNISVALKEPFGLNKWHHVVMVLRDGLKSYYVDGVALTPANFKQDVLINEGDLLFGSDPFGVQEYHYGALDDIRVYDRALSEDEIRTLANDK